MFAITESKYLLYKPSFLEIYTLFFLNIGIIGLFSKTEKFEAENIKFVCKKHKHKKNPNIMRQEHVSKRDGWFRPQMLRCIKPAYYTSIISTNKPLTDFRGKCTHVELTCLRYWANINVVLQHTHFFISMNLY